jgi:PPM family protein phosphatase
MLNLKSGYLSVTGNFRENNEDACVVDESGRFFIVADGMGGQAAGEKASELATDIVPRKLDQLIDFSADSGETLTQKIDESVGEANSEILALSELDPTYHNMGTTIVFIVVSAENFYVGGIGDSRVYCLRDGELKQLTTDHSLTRALVEAGTISEEDAATHRYRNVLYRYLGSKEGGTGTEAKEHAPKSGDRYLICSDGVTDGIDDPAIQAVLAENDEPQQCAEAMVQAALDGGSKDNVTSVIVYVE